LSLRWTFRGKLIAIVGSASFALVVLIVSGSLLSQRVTRQLRHIQDVLVPKLELGPKLSGQFAAITRALQDAVAAQDPDAIAETGELKDELLRELAGATGVVDPVAAQALKIMVEDYVAVAQQVSRRIVAGEKAKSCWWPSPRCKRSSGWRPSSWIEPFSSAGESCPRSSRPPRATRRPPRSFGCG
jgi:hypothetical protein